eukprot:TRINITY_DN6359_c1_g2_i1.p1 TRINITY_DN6359_c1_g2~~TRINITY_DN6359_c1_g2_i1.p1  ORF type:complete len:394 (+),score=21.88 TRINITY_DN6359_c1_g2_i1:88-1269(+)
MISRVLHRVFPPALSTAVPSDYEDYPGIPRYNIRSLPHLRNDPFIIQGLMANWQALHRWQNPNYFLYPDWQWRMLRVSIGKTADASFVDPMTTPRDGSPLWFLDKRVDSLAAVPPMLMAATPRHMRSWTPVNDMKFGHFIWHHLIPHWPTERPSPEAFGGHIAHEWKKRMGLLRHNLPDVVSSHSPPPVSQDVVYLSHAPMHNVIPEILDDLGDQADWLLQRYAMSKVAPKFFWAHPPQFDPLNYTHDGQIACNVVGVRRYVVMRPSRGQAMSPSMMDPRVSLVGNPFSIDRNRHPKFPPQSEMQVGVLQPGEALYVPPSWWRASVAETASLMTLFDYKPSPNLRSAVMTPSRMLGRDPRHENPALMHPAQPLHGRGQAYGIGGDPRMCRLPP